MTRDHKSCLGAAGLGALLCAGLSAQTPVVRLERGRLLVSVPTVRFLSGRALERLKNGASATFDIQLSLRAQSRGLIRGREAGRFVASYDLWEEKFSVTRVAPSPRSVSRLSALAAENWCLKELALPSSRLHPQDPFWIRLEVRLEDPQDRTPVVGETGISLARLIELFSRPPRRPQARWLEEIGPQRLADLSSPAARGPTGK